MIAIILFFLIAIAVLLTIIIYVIKNNKRNKFYNQFNSPPAIPFLGNALDFTEKSKAVLSTFIEYAKKYGGIVCVKIGPAHRFLLTSDYKLVEFVLSSTKIIKKSYNYRFLTPWLGTGLLTSDGAKWKKHRRIITPAFHFKILEQFLNSFEQQGELFIEKLRSKVGLNSFDVYPLVTLCTLDIICETAMGTSIKAQSFADSKYVKSVKEMGRIIVERALAPQKNDLFFRFTEDYHNQVKALKVLHQTTNDVINRRREGLKQNEDKKFNDYGIKQKVAFLDLLLQASIDGVPLTHEDIREEVDTFMFEGHDTTASGISFAIYSLATNPKVQEQAFEEQKSLFGDNFKNASVTYNDLQNMKYLEKVIKETLRLYPSVPFYARETTEDILYDGKIIPKNVNIILFAYGIHRNSDYFPNPDKFDPDRFDSIDGTYPYAYIPFSAGPRNCIGQKFAMLEMKSTISKVIRNFKLSAARPHHNLDLVAETVLKSANGVHISIEERV